MYYIKILILASLVIGIAVFLSFKNLEWILILLLGLALFIGGIWIFSKNKSANNFLVISGKLISKRMTTETVVDGQKLNRWGHHPYCLEVEYEFSVDGVLYKGNKVRFSSIEYLDKNIAESKLEKIAEPLEIYYNPKNPQESFLYKEPKWIPYLFIGCGVFAILFGLRKALS